MEDNIILYSTSTCPQCSNLKRVLNAKGVKYKICDDTEKMISLGITNIPVLSVDGEMMNYKNALLWANKE